MKPNSGSSVGARFPVIYELGYEQFINTRLSLSLTGGWSISNDIGSDYFSLNNFNVADVSHGKVFNLTYEAKYFFSESDGYNVDGMYLSSSLTYRNIDEKISGSLGKKDTRLTCFPYSLKLGTRSTWEYMGIFADWYIGLGFNAATITKRGPYEPYTSKMSKPAVVPFTIGFTMGYAF